MANVKRVIITNYIHHLWVVGVPDPLRHLHAPLRLRCKVDDEKAGDLVKDVVKTVVYNSPQKGVVGEEVVTGHGKLSQVKRS